MRFLCLNVHTEYFHREISSTGGGGERERERKRDRRNVTIGERLMRNVLEICYTIFINVLCVPSLHAYMYICICIYARVYVYICIYLRGEV